MMESRRRSRATPIPMPALVPMERPADELGRLRALEVEGVFFVTKIVVAGTLEALPLICSYSDRAEVDVDVGVDFPMHQPHNLKSTLLPARCLEKDCAQSRVVLELYKLCFS